MKALLRVVLLSAGLLGCVGSCVPMDLLFEIRFKVDCANGNTPDDCVARLLAKDTLKVLDTSPCDKDGESHRTGFTVGPPPEEYVLQVECRSCGGEFVTLEIRTEAGRNYYEHPLDLGSITIPAGNDSESNQAE